LAARLQLIETTERGDHLLAHLATVAAALNDLQIGAPGRKRPTNRALAVHCRAWEVCSVIGKLVSTHDDGYGFGWPGAPAAMDEL
jgi:hypothetical protein